MTNDDPTLVPTASTPENRNSRRWNHDGKEDVQDSKTENQITEICHLSKKSPQKKEDCTIKKKETEYRVSMVFFKWPQIGWIGPSGSWSSDVKNAGLKCLVVL